MKTKTLVFTLFLTLTLLFLFFYCCSDKHQKENSLTRGNIKGRVSSIEIFSSPAVERYGELEKTGEVTRSTYKYDEQGNEIEAKLYNKYGSLSSRFTWTYDEQGNKIEDNKYTPGNELFEASRIRYTYRYNEKGNQIETNYFERDGLEGRWKKKYDEQGNLIESIRYNSDGSLWFRATYRYNEKGKKIETNSFGHPSAKPRSTHKYNEQGNLIEENNYNRDGSLDSRHTYRYDEQNNQIESNRYNSDGSLGYRHTCRYDEQGDLIEQNFYGQDGVFNRGETFKYDEYDKMGNWIKKTTRNANGEYYYISERKIEYYQ